MSLQHHLRQRNESRVALEQLRDRHPGSEIVTLLPDERYLQVLLQDEQGSRMQAWFNIDTWLNEMDVHLPDIPWGEVPLDYLARWLNHLQLGFRYVENTLEAIKIVSAMSALPVRALSLPSAPCPLLCVEWADREDTADEGQARAADWVPFRLRYVLGYSPLTVAQLADVSVGDLLLIKENFVHLAVGERRLYRLSYYPHQEVIVEELLTEHHQQSLDEEEVLHDWSALPVELEFVLGGRTATLAELEDIIPGTALALGPDAEQHIKIYLNKKLFARGELVALENGGLAVEVRHVNPTLTGSAEHSDAQ